MFIPIYENLHLLCYSHNVSQEVTHYLLSITKHPPQKTFFKIRTTPSPSPGGRIPDHLREGLHHKWLGSKVSIPWQVLPEGEHNRDQRGGNRDHQTSRQKGRHRHSCRSWLWHPWRPHPGVHPEIWRKAHEPECKLWKILWRAIYR